MNNQEMLFKLAETFKSLDRNKFAETCIRLFGEGGGTKILGKNPDCLIGMSEACIEKAFTDIENGQITVEKLPVYIAMLGVASGMTLGVYSMAEVFGVTDQLLEGAETSVEQAQSKLEAAHQKYTKQSKIKYDFEAMFKSDPSMN